jgi:hypothetical protein
MELVPFYESLIIIDSLTEIDTDYFRGSIITKKLAGGQKHIHLRARFEKLYNEEM